MATCQCRLCDSSRCRMSRSYAAARCMDPSPLAKPLAAAFASDFLSPDYLRSITTLNATRICLPRLPDCNPFKSKHMPP